MPSRPAHATRHRQQRATTNRREARGREKRSPATTIRPPPSLVVLLLLLHPSKKSSKIEGTRPQSLPPDARRTEALDRIGAGGGEMWESVALTLAGTAGNNIGKVLQKKGTHILPPLSLKLKVFAPARPLPPPDCFRSRSRRRGPYEPWRSCPCPCAQVVKAYAFNQLWISGFLMDMCGAALMLTALSQAPVRLPLFLCAFMRPPSSGSIACACLAES